MLYTSARIYSNLAKCKSNATAAIFIHMIERETPFERRMNKKKTANNLPARYRNAFLSFLVRDRASRMARDDIET